jgi:hypothetical protein
MRVRGSKHYTRAHQAISVAAASTATSPKATRYQAPTSPPAGGGGRGRTSDSEANSCIMRTCDAGSRSKCLLGWSCVRLGHVNAYHLCGVRWSTGDCKNV